MQFYLQWFGSLEFYNYDMPFTILSQWDLHDNLFLNKKDPHHSEEKLIFTLCPHHGGANMYIIVIKYLLRRVLTMLNYNPA